jgi:hypothetical protein
MEVTRKVARKFGASVLALPLVIGSAAHAALPTGVTTAIETAETDLTGLLATLTAAGVVVWVAAVIYARFRVK